VPKKRDSNRLDPLKVSSLVKNAAKGTHADGGGLYLVVEANSTARWSFIYRWRDNPSRPGPGRRREMGLGSVGAVPLRRARERAAEARGLLAEGADPIAARRAHRETPTFGELADEVLANKSAETTSKASVARLKRALEVYAEPLRALRVDAVDTAAVLDVLKPIWTTKTETAQKTRGLIEAVLNAAKAKGYRSGDNPALWRGHLDHVLPRLSKRERSHHAAMSRHDLPAFVTALHKREGVSALALEFLILTAARVGEVIGADWNEIDLDASVWNRPATRMKNRKGHRVPLSARALEILKGLDGRSGPVFAGEKAGQGLSSGAFDRLLDRMKTQNSTVHGFRSTFRDWVGEVSDFPTELAEAALAHTVGDATERAYARGDALEKRRAMMQAWAEFVSNES
jgi:integrase